MKSYIVSTNFFMRIIATVCISYMFTGCYYYDTEQELYGTVCDTSVTTYTGYVKPMLDANCNTCHSGNTPSGQIDLTTYANVKANVDNGKLYGSIAQLSGYKAMPQGGQLSKCDISKVKIWIDAGAQQN